MQVGSERGATGRGRNEQVADGGKGIDETLQSAPRPEPLHGPLPLSQRRHAAKTLVKARILLKADISEAGEGLSDGEIIEQLETSASMVYRVRKQLVEEGFAAVLTRKPHTRPSVSRIFDGEKEARLIALSCSAPPKGERRELAEAARNAFLFVIQTDSAIQTDSSTAIVIIVDIGGAPAMLATVAAPDPINQAATLSRRC
jgi:hypothetical protein